MGDFMIEKNASEEPRTITIEPLSPVFVWSREKLSSRADYRISNNRLTIIDFNEAIKKGARTLQDVISSDAVRIFHGQRLEFPVSGNPSNISEIYFPQESVVPGSTLKGLIRTAFLSQFKNNYQSDVNKQLNALKAAVSSGNYNEARSPVKSLASEIEKKLIKREIVYNFGHRVCKNTYDAFKTLLISDPQKYENLKFDLVKVEIRGKKKVISNNFVIALTEGKLYYDAKIVKPPKYQELKILDKVYEVNDLISWDKITKSLQEFSKHVLNKEIQKVRKLNSSGRYETYYKFLENLKKEAENTSNNCFILRMGMFTGHASKTLPLNAQNEKLREDVLTKLYRKPWDDNTIKLADVGSGKVGLGWIRLCIQ